MSKLGSWFKKLISGEPHFVIGRSAGAYMLRWYLGKGCGE